jgi:NAD+ diphosphatase
LNDRENGTDKEMDESQRSASVPAHSNPIIFPKELSGTESQAIASKEEEPPFRVPPMTAIAGALIRHWAEGKMQSNSAIVKKGNL